MDTAPFFLLVFLFTCSESKLVLHRNGNDIYSFGIENPLIDGEKVDGNESEDIKVGQTVSVFQMFGNLTHTFNVGLSGCKETWLHRGNWSTIFKRGTFRPKTLYPTKSVAVDDYFLLDFCETSQELLQAFFEFQKIDGVWNNDKFFTSFISRERKAALLGLHTNYLSHTQSFSFVLVRFFRRDVTVDLDGQLELSQDFRKNFGNVVIGSAASALNLTDTFGSHVVSQYELGDALFQVLVYEPGAFQKLKANSSLSGELVSDTFLVSNHNSSDLIIETLLNNASNVGKIKTLSGCLERELLMSNKSPPSPLLYLLREQEIRRKFVQSPHHVITAMTLQRITRYMDTYSGISLFSSTFKNLLMLYETNAGERDD